MIKIKQHGMMKTERRERIPVDSGATVRRDIYEKECETGA